MPTTVTHLATELPALQSHNQPLSHAVNSSEVENTGTNGLANAKSQNENEDFHTFDHQRMPFYFNLKLGNIGMQLESVPTKVSQFLFSPNTLTPSVKNLNPTVHLTPRHWALVLGHLNVSGLKVESLIEELWRELEQILDQKRQAVANNLTNLESKYESTVQRLNKITQEIRSIKTAHRHFRSNPELSALVSDLESKQKSEKLTKNSIKASLKKLKFDTQGWPNKNSLEVFIKNLAEQGKLGSTLLILKLVNEKYDACEKKLFNLAAQEFLSQEKVEWSPLAKELGDVIGFAIDHHPTDFTPPFSYSHLQFPGYHESSVGDCVETALRNFLKMLVETRPSHISQAQWFETLNLKHLTPFLENICGDDCIEKHKEFVTLLNHTPDFSPEIRPLEGCIKAGQVYENLSQLLRQSPYDVAVTTGAFKEISLDLEQSEFELLAHDGTKVYLLDHSQHAELEIQTPRHDNIPHFLKTVDQTAPIDEIGDVLLMHLGQIKLKSALDHFLERDRWNPSKDIVDIAATYKQWHALIKKIEPVEYSHPARVLITEFDGHTRSLNPSDSWLFEVRDMDKTLALVQQCSNPSQAFVGIIGPKRCVRAFETIVDDSKLFQIFHQAMNQSPLFLSHFLNIMKRDNHTLYSPTLLKFFRGTLLKLSPKARHQTLTRARTLDLWLGISTQSGWEKNTARYYTHRNKELGTTAKFFILSLAALDAFMIGSFVRTNHCIKQQCKPPNHPSLNFDLLNPIQSFKSLFNTDQQCLLLSREHLQNTWDAQSQLFRVAENIHQCHEQYNYPEAALRFLLEIQVPAHWPISSTNTITPKSKPLVDAIMTDLFGALYKATFFAQYN